MPSKPDKLFAPDELATMAETDKAAVFQIGAEGCTEFQNNKTARIAKDTRNQCDRIMCPLYANCVCKIRMLAGREDTQFTSQ
ncbi:hypothetical protein KJ742_05850 [Patescibacteria group bacterium]|nr:hypothetical protein [Patescibacteria group bacterium]MBU1683439.1 hypothetical protein [Patescibacteria group bacterium]MBU1934985.1 hypothetical protein [Patescibacteria group bacterium]